MRINKETIAKTMPMLAAAVLCTAGAALGAGRSTSFSANTTGANTTPINGVVGGIAAASCGGTEITQNSSFVAAVGTVSCNTGAAGTPPFVNTDNFYARNYPIAAPVFVKCVDFAVEANNLPAGPYSVRVRLYTHPTPGTPITANMTLIAGSEMMVSIPAGVSPVVTALYPGSGVLVPAGNLVVELFTPCRTAACTPPGDTGSCFLGSNAAAETAPTYIKAPGATACNINDYVTMASINFPNVHILQRLGTAAGNPCDVPLPACAADMTGPSGPNGVVNVDDLLLVLNNWNAVQTPPGTGPRPPGDCAPGPNNGPGNCVVNVDDLLKVLNSWGACPIPTGACCALPSGACSIQTQTACNNSGGTYRGDGTTCPPTPPCPVLPANDECPGRIVVTNGTTNIADNTAATANLATPGGACAFGGASNFNHDVWFTYTATCTGNLTVDTCATTGAVTDTVISVYSGACSALTEIGCDDDACTGNPAGDKSRVIVPVTNGTVYRIRVGTWNNTATGPMVLTVSCALANDDFCTDATALGPYPATESDSLEFATAETPNPAPCGTPPIQPGLGRWYTCIGNGNTLTASTCASPAEIYNMNISVYCGTACNSLVCVTAQNLDNCGPGGFFQETMSWCSANGQKYWILLWTDSQPDPGLGNYVLNVTSGAACGPASSCVNANSDECDPAPTWVFGANSVDNTGMTNSTAPDPLCVVGGAANFTRDLWGKYTATTTGPLQIDTCATTGSVTDTVLAVYSGACSALVVVACDDDACTGNPAGDKSKVNFNAVNGVEYKIRVGSWGATAAGPMVVTIATGVAGPANDECATASPVVLGANPITNVGATTSTGIPGATCTVGGVANFTRDVWFTHTAAATGNMQFDLCATTGAVTDTVITVYIGACTALVDVGCDDDACTGNPAGDKSKVIVAVTAGTQYRIRVGSWGGTAAGPMVLTLSVAAPPACPPVLPANCTNMIAGNGAFDGINGIRPSAGWVNGALGIMEDLVFCNAGGGTISNMRVTTLDQTAAGTGTLSTYTTMRINIYPAPAGIAALDPLTAVPTYTHDFVSGVDAVKTICGVGFGIDAECWALTVTPSVHLAQGTYGYYMSFPQLTNAAAPSVFIATGGGSPNDSSPAGARIWGQNPPGTAINAASSPTQHSSYCAGGTVP